MLDQIIKKFCGDESANLDRPTIEGDNIIATDKHILIVAPKHHFEREYTAVVGFVKWRSVWPEFNSHAILEKIDTATIIEHYNTLEQYPSYGLCDKCDGKGIEKVCECCGQDVECKYCNGSGTSMRITNYHIELGQQCAQIRDTYFELEYINTLALVAAEMKSDLNLIVLATKGACVFSVADILMILMPIREPYENILQL